MTAPEPELRDRLAEDAALRLNGPANDGRGWYRNDTERTQCYALADAVAAVVQPELDWADREILRLRDHNDDNCEAVAERDRLREEHAEDTGVIKALRRQRDEAEAERDQARTTNQRLNLRCQQAESKIAAFERLVGEWQFLDKGTYVPLRTLVAIAKLAGRDVDEGRFELHYQRVGQLEARLEAVTSVQIHRRGRGRGFSWEADLRRALGQEASS